MKYVTLTGRRFDLTVLDLEERRFLRDVLALFRERPSWEEFSAAWPELAQTRLWRDGPVPVGTPVYRICQDLAARLGIAEERVARPDYRDQLADRIEERFGSRYRFCKATGVDPAHLSRVLAGRKHFASETLFRVLDVLGLELTVAEGTDAGDNAGEARQATEEQQLFEGPAETEAWLEQESSLEGMPREVERPLASARLPDGIASHL